MKRFSHCIGPILLLILVLGASGGCSKGARARRLLEAGDRDFKAEKYDDAEVEYNNVRRLVGMNPTAIGQLGRIYAKEGKMGEAKYFLLKATELQPDSLPFQLALGQTYASLRNSTNAVQIARRILSAQPTNEEALLLLLDSSPSGPELRRQLQSLPGVAGNASYHLALAQVALRDKKLAVVADELRLAVAANPKSSQTYYALAELHSMQKEEKEAAQALQNAAAFAPMRSPIRIKYADYLLHTGSKEQARKILQEMTEKAPDYIPSQTALMNLAMGERKYDAAAKLADTVLARDDENYEAMLTRGAVSLAKGDTGKAIIQFERTDSLFKKIPQVKYQLAMAYLLSRDRVKGMAYLNQALALNPAYPQAALLMAQLDIRGGDPGAAVTLLTRFVKKAPGVSQAHTLLADAYLAQQKPDDALAAYRKLAEIYPDSPQVPLLMGMVLAMQHKTSEARASFERCLELAPDYLAAVEQLINLDLAAHHYNDAVALAESQISKTPKAAEPWEIMAKIDLAQTNLAHAETSLLKAIELNPDLSNPYLMLARVYLRGTNYEPALQKLNALVARTNDAPAYLMIGAIQGELKHYQLSCDAYEKVLKINEKSLPAINNLAYTYAVWLNKIDRAYELAQKARDLRPYDPNVDDTLGWILFKKGDYPRALALLEDSAEKQPGDAEIQFHLGMTHYMMDEEAAARVALQRAVATPQDYANKEEAATRLAVLDMKTTGAGPSVLAGLEKALQEHPNDPVILNRIGVMEEQTGAFEKAAATYETALKQNPDAVHIMAKLARLYASRLNQPEKALSLATQAHNLAPENAEVNGVLGHVVFHNGDYTWALSLLENAADRLPNQPQLLYDLAWACYSVGRISDAAAAMQKALQTGLGLPESEDAQHFVALADAFNSPSEIQTAAAPAQKILQADARYVPALMVSGAAEERAGNFKEAHDAWQKALDVFPQFAPAARQLAMLDARHFIDDPHGYDLAEKAFSAYPDDLTLAESVGILGYYQKKYARSGDVLQAAIAKSPNDGELYYYLGMDYSQLQQNKESKQALARALALKIPDKLATAARQTLAQLK